MMKGILRIKQHGITLLHQVADKVIGHHKRIHLVVPHHLHRAAKDDLAVYILKALRFYIIDGYDLIAVPEPDVRGNGINAPYAIGKVFIGQVLSRPRYKAQPNK